MHTIYKYELPVLETFELDLPNDAQIIRVDDVKGKFYLWAIVDTEAPPQKRYFEAYKTGMPFKNQPHHLYYLGLCKLFIMQELGMYVFENISKRYNLNVTAA